MIYVDDSGQRKPRRKHLGELVAIGGVLVPEPAVAGYAAALQQIRQDLAVPDGEEIKWKPARGTFLASAGGELIGELRRRMLTEAAAQNIRSAVVVWDRGHVDWENHRVGPEILKYLYERITMFLEEQRDIGIVVADEPGGGPKAEKEWLAATLGLTTGGTRYAPPDRVVSPILTAPSHHVPHLQLADLVTAATTAAVAGMPSGLDLVPQLKGLARTNARGYIGGAGLVLWPQQIYDLYYWVLGEDTYVRGSTGHPLGPSSVTDPFSRPGRTFERTSGLEA
jgi:hypothetical protein